MAMMLTDFDDRVRAGVRQADEQRAVQGLVGGDRGAGTGHDHAERPYVTSTRSLGLCRTTCAGKAKGVPGLPVPVQRDPRRSRKGRRWSPLPGRSIHRRPRSAASAGVSEPPRSRPGPESSARPSRPSAPRPHRSQRRRCRTAAGPRQASRRAGRHDRGQAVIPARPQHRRDPQPGVVAAPAAAAPPAISRLPAHMVTMRRTREARKADGCCQPPTPRTACHPE